MEEKAWNEAARELQAAVVMQPNSVQLRDTLAQVYASMGNERLKDALREFQTAAKLNPDYRQVQYNIGVAYSRLGKHREALRAFTRAARLQNAPWEYAGMACSYLALKRMDEARWAARKAASLDPDNPEYRRLLEQLGEDTGPLSVPARP
jgi:tetratricopeptide (TPR) repeat protein